MQAKFKLFFLAAFCLLLVKPCHAEEKKPFWSRFSLKLSGGGGFTAIGDMNSHLESINKNETFDYWRKHDPISISGEIKKLNNWEYDFELELMMKLSPKFSIGLATSAPFSRSNESSLIFVQQEVPGLGYQKIKMEYRPEIKLSFPIKLSFYYYFLSRTRFKANILGGIGYYPGNLSEYAKETLYVYLLGSPTPNVSWGSDDWNAKGKYPFGFHGGIGLEYILNEEFSLLVDIQGRYVRIGNLRASGEYREAAISFERSGVLYYFTYWHPIIEAKYGIFYIRQTDEEGGDDIRKAILDLGGFSLRVGVKINLF